MMKSSDSLLDRDTVDALRAHLAGASGVTIVRSACPGVGVSTLLECLLGELDFEVVHVATALPKLKALLTDACTSSVSVTMRRKIILLDPIDSIIADVSAAMDLADFSKRPRRVPVLIAGCRQRSSHTRVDDMFGKKSATFHFPALADDVAVARLLELSPTGDVRSVWARAQGDFRSACNALGILLGASATKDEVCDGVDAIARILGGVSMRDAMRVQGGDTSMVSSGVFENYHAMRPTVHQAAQIADLFSKADAVDEMIYGKQRWDLTEYYAALTAGGPAVVLSSARAPPAVPVIAKYGTVWSRSNNQRTKEKAIRAVRMQLAENGCGGMDVGDLALVRAMVAQCSRRGDYAAGAGLMRGTLEPDGVLHVMRLFKTWSYPQSEHAKFKKAALKDE